MNKNLHHFENSKFIQATPEKVFEYADNHSNFSSHMNKSSLMMGGGKMETTTDEDKGQKVGSHILMTGKFLGIHLSLDEVIIERNPPHKKVWQTVGIPKLIIIGNYQMSLEIKTGGNNSMLTVSIDYSLPKSPTTHWLGILFAKPYAKWCVNQMINGTYNHFEKEKQI